MDHPTTDYPTENLVRTNRLPGVVELRAADDGGDGKTLHGHFSVFDHWYEINSWYEGRFLERVARGAFARTFAENGSKIRVLYEHGADPAIGNKPIGIPRSITEDKIGAAYEVELFASVPPLVMDGLRAGQYGASFRFRVRDEQWHDPTKATAHNPERLPERTILDTDVFEFGPVTFGASDAATAALRGGTDLFLQPLFESPLAIARLIERTSPRAVENLLEALAAHGHGGDNTAPHGPTAPAPTGRSVAQIRALAVAQGLSLRSEP